MDEFLKSLKGSIQCRDSQLTEIYEYIGEHDEPVPPCLYLYGNMATGKTLCITKTLHRLKYNHVILNAVECYSPKIIYETILNTLSEHEYKKENMYKPRYKCDNMKDFLINLNNIFHDYKYEPIVIVIDKADRLRDMDLNILPVFLRLKEYCTLNICTILISDIAFEKYYSKTGLKEPLKIFFPQYTKDELYKIIFLNQPEFTQYVIHKKSIDVKSIKEDIGRKDVFANYLNAFLSVFYRHCRDLVELKHMAKLNYVVYCDPIIDETIKADDVTKLWRKIAPALKTSMELLYLRLNPNKNPEQVDVVSKMAHLGITKNDMSIINDELTSTKTLVQNFELPFYAKYLLVAAYLASFNPAKEDKRLFMKYHGKQRKKMRQVNAKAVISEKLNTQLGPKQFTLDRLLAIFYSILEERAGLTANLLVQVSSLVSLRLLTASSDATKYKCTVGYDFILEISKMVGFNIRKYLYDFI